MLTPQTTLDDTMYDDEVPLPTVELPWNSRRFPVRSPDRGRPAATVKTSKSTYKKYRFLPTEFLLTLQLEIV